MKKNIFNSVYAFVMAALCFFFVGCSDFDNGFSEKDIEYGKDFVNIFGNVDPKQDWSMAKLVNVNMAVSGTYLELYSGAPVIATSKLLLSTKLGESSVAFNVTGGAEQVYAIVKNEKGGTVVQGFYDIQDESITITDTPAKKKLAKGLYTRAASNVTKGRVQENLIKVAESESLGEKYYYNGSYYTLEELREWATNNPNLNQSYHAPFNADCIVPAAWDFSNATLNESNTYVAEKEGYYHVYNKDNQNIKTIFSLDELKQFVKETYGLGAQYYCGNLFNGITVVDNELNFDNATVNESVARPITANTIVYDDKFYSWESLVDMLEKNEPANYQESNGPFLNCVIPTHLDFTNATVDLTKVSLQQEVIDKSFYINLTYLNGVEKWAADPWTLSVGAQLFGYGGFFKESVYYFDQQKTVLYGSTFDEQLEILQKIESGFSVTTKGGEIELPFIYGATGLYDQFGYVYYKEGQDPLKQPHYVLMDNATPQANIYFEGWANSGKAVWNMELSNWSEEYKTLYDKDPETKVYGTKYKLAFFGENHDQTATYEFPEGYHIVFFISPSDATPGSDTMAGYAIGDFNYSLPELNARIGHYYSNTSSLTYQQGKAPLGAVKAVAWEADGITALGFEDGGRDEDLNDVVFWLEGEFEADQELVEVEVATNNESESWIFACEDLGGSFDYDFNDVVWEVYKEYKTTTTTTTENGVSSSTTTKEFVAGKVRLLAAGGTLPVELYYNERSLGDVHQLFGQQPVGVDLYHQVNVGTKVEKTPIELLIPDLTITATTNINDIKNNFKVRVKGEQGNSHFVTAPDMNSTAPQIILLPGDWEWPRENVSITAAYPEFTNWVQDKTWTDWAETWVSGNTVNRSKNRSTNSSGGSSDVNTGGNGNDSGNNDNTGGGNAENESLEEPELNVYNMEIDGWFGVGGSYSDGFRTNSDGQITLTSSNEEVVSAELGMSGDGNRCIVYHGKGIGEATVTMHLAATSQYKEATRTIIVKIR